MEKTELHPSAAISTMLRNRAKGLERNSIVNGLRQLIGRIQLTLRGKNRVIGWNMTPAQAHAFFLNQGKAVLTLLGFSSGYEDEAAMLETVQRILSKNSPETYVVNIGATKGGIGAVYPMAKFLGYTTTGIVSTLALEDAAQISEEVDYICFIADDRWGGKLPDSNELSPTSQAMVACSHILISIGGGEISRDEMLGARELGKPIRFFPAEVDHERAIRNAVESGAPKPESFWGEAHEVFSKQG